MWPSMNAEMSNITCMCVCVIDLWPTQLLWATFIKCVRVWCVCVCVRVWKSAPTSRQYPDKRNEKRFHTVWVHFHLTGLIRDTVNFCVRTRLAKGRCRFTAASSTIGWIRLHNAWFGDVYAHIYHPCRYRFPGCGNATRCIFVIHLSYRQASELCNVRTAL